MEKRSVLSFLVQAPSLSIHSYIHSVYKYLPGPQAAQACRGEGHADARTVLGARRCRTISGSSLSLAAILHAGCRSPGEVYMLFLRVGINRCGTCAVPDLMFCCSCLEILYNFSSRGPDYIVGPPYSPTPRTTESDSLGVRVWASRFLKSGVSC